MGLFDKFKKKNNEEVAVEETIEEVVEKAVEVEVEEKVAQATQAEPIEESKQQEQVEENKQQEPSQSEPQASTVMNDGRRFTFLVENAKQLTPEEGIMLAGMLYGDVQVGDEVYLILPNLNVGTTKVDAIEIAAGQNAESAHNQKVVLQFKEIKDINQVPRYTVITSISPLTKPSVDTMIENPHLLGLSMDYPRLNKDPLYMNLLVYAMCHAYFLVPARVSANPVKNGDGTSVFRQDTQVRFPGLPDPTDKNKSVFTVFTDWMALANWKNLFDEEHPPKAIIMRFPDVVNVSNGNSVILNPYGPTSVMLPADVVKKITTLEGYKQEFGAKED